VPARTLPDRRLLRKSGQSLRLTSHQIPRGIRFLVEEQKFFEGGAVPAQRIIRQQKVVFKHGKHEQIVLDVLFHLRTLFHQIPVLVVGNNDTVFDHGNFDDESVVIRVHSFAVNSLSGRGPRDTPAANQSSGRVSIIN